MLFPHIPQTGLLFRVGLALTETGGGGEKLKVGQMIRWPYNRKVFLTLKWNYGVPLLTKISSLRDKYLFFLKVYEG